MTTTIERLKRLPTLLRGEFSSLLLSFNDQHAPNYCTAQKHEDECGPDVWVGDWVSEDEHRKALATNSVWCLHWYPDTPVGFVALLASDLDVLLEAALAD